MILLVAHWLTSREDLLNYQSCSARVNVAVEPSYFAIEHFFVGVLDYSDQTFPFRAVT